MIDDINISTVIINNPQIQVHFNTSAQPTRLNKTADWIFHL
ncbi:MULTISPECIES: hypothetical protein [unclassified Nostoc]|nr:MULTISPECIES: hypothetical protein [unclassified Nostoc]